MPLALARRVRACVCLGRRGAGLAEARRGAEPRLAPCARADKSDSAPRRLGASGLARSTRPAVQNLGIFIVPSKHLEVVSIASSCHQFAV